MAEPSSPAPGPPRGGPSGGGAITAEVVGRVWRWSGGSAWHFLTLPGDLSDEIRSRVEPVGFGSVRVTAAIGATTWSTSVFPDKSSGCYVLPVKAAVRRAEGIITDDEVEVVIVVEG